MVRPLRDLLILNADDPHAAEMVEIAERINGVSPTWNLLGFVAAKPERVGGMLNGYPLFDAGALDAYPNAAIAEFGWRGAVAMERRATLVDPSAFVSRTAQVGPGCILYPNCFVGLNAVLGARVFCLSGAIINDDDCLEDGVVLCSGATLAGGVYVEADSYLGQGCQVRQNLRIGRRSLVGMGAVVVKDVLPESVVVGNPARLLRSNT